MKTLAALMLIAVGLSGCGQTGPLYLPKPEQPTLEQPAPEQSTSEIPPPTIDPPVESEYAPLP